MTKTELAAVVAKEANIPTGIAEKALDALVKIEKSAPAFDDGEAIIKFERYQTKAKEWDGTPALLDFKESGKYEELALKRACDKLARGVYQIHEQVKAIMSDFERYQAKAKELEGKIKEYGF